MLPAIERAKKCGTLNALDRSRQYAGATEAEYRSAVDKAHEHLRAHDKALSSKDAEIQALRDGRHRDRWIISALISVLTSPAWLPWAIESVKSLLAHWPK